MNHKLALGAVALTAAALGSGYWLGTRAPGDAANGHASSTSSTERKVLFYRNPMGLPDTSPVPKKDPMGMDYIPVYEGEEPASKNSGIKVSTEKMQRLGVRTEPATMRALDRTVRAAGRVEPDERRTFTIAPKFEGYVERLHVNVTGQAVTRGQPLFEVYSPELVSAQREYAIAMDGLRALKDGSEEVQAGMRQLADGSLARLKNWDISEEQIKTLSRTSESRRTLTFRSPVSGIVSERMAVQGMRFDAGEALYQISDLSSVWVIADVFEQDIGLIKRGSKALVSISAYPDRKFDGTVSYVYPTLNADTRTVPIRVELKNPQQLLKPAMFAQVELSLGNQQPVLTVPHGAVIDSGTRALVIVQTGEGTFEPREVRLGARGQQYVQVLSGIQLNDPVVVAANFLIDAESNLQAAIGGFGGGQAPAQSAAGNVTHRANGEVESIDASTGAMMLKHDPIASLNWPAMTMEFQSSHAGLAAGLKPGQTVTFEFVERAPGEYVVTKIAPRSAPNSTSNNTPSAAPKKAAPAASHSGH